MPQTSICRMCLGTDLRMIAIAGTPLQAVYEKITDAELLDNMKPVVACYFCLAQLRRCRSFMEKSVKADEVLNGILMNSKLTLKAIARVDRESYKLSHNLSIKVQTNENDEELESKVKMEVEFEFAGGEDQVVAFEGHAGMPQLIEPVIDEKAFEQSDNTDYFEVGFMKEEEQHEEKEEIGAVSDGDENRDAPSDDEPLKVIAKVKRKRKADSATKKPAKQKKRIILVKKRRPANQNKGLRKTTLKRSLECRNCQTKFENEDEMTAHFKEHRPFPCDICEKKFRTAGALKGHLAIHKGEKPFQCYECGTQFSRAHHLRNHLRTHSGEVPYECNVCNRKFNNSSNLRQHLRTHTGEKPYECDICQRKFAEKKTMQKHVRTHAPGRCNDLQNVREKPYKCAECGAGFVRIHHLKRHLIIHTGEKPFECNVCYRKFNRKSTLTTHLKTHLSEPKPYNFNLPRAEPVVHPNIQ